MKTRKHILVGLTFTLLLAGAISYTIHLYLNRELKPQSYGELIALSNKQLLHVDVARINLLCSEGLSGAENIDMAYCFQTLDKWAEHVLAMEKKNTPAFYNNPSRYDNSFALFKMVYMAHALKLDFKCGYNMKLVRSGAVSDLRSLRMFANSTDLFLHGFIDKNASRKGTCGSLPFLMVAVGRRCGYPVHLVTTKGHAFCRWDDGKEKHNLEISSRGVSNKSDEEYTKAPYPFTKEEAQREGFLVNQSAVGELAVSLDQRGACQMENKQFEEAYNTYLELVKRKPNSIRSRELLQRVQRRCGK